MRLTPSVPVSPRLAVVGWLAVCLSVPPPRVCLVLWPPELGRGRLTHFTTIGSCHVPRHFTTIGSCHVPRHFTIGSCHFTTIGTSEVPRHFSTIGTSDVPRHFTTIGGCHFTTIGTSEAPRHFTTVGTSHAVRPLNPVSGRHRKGRGADRLQRRRAVSWRVDHVIVISVSSCDHS